MAATSRVGPVRYACPHCRGPLRSDGSAWYCRGCGRTYPVVGGIPDFITEGARADLAPVRSLARKVDLLAPIYESRLWYLFALRVAGARRTSLEGIARFHAESLAGVTGAVLDVACGPATYSRRLASPSRHVYGIDISMGMLRTGIAYVERDQVQGVHLARARVEQLPFEDAVFDGAVCSGALHLFPDTVSSLREIARTLRAGAPLTVQTFIGRNSGIDLLLRLFRLQRQVHKFEVPELRQYLVEAGFEGFRSKLDGLLLLFSTRKAT